MPPTIAVDLPPADVASPHAQALLDTCTLGAQLRARCVFGPTNPGSDQDLAVATVAWDGPARTAAHIEVGLPAGESKRGRDLSFSSGDAEVERWRTVGFAIATIAVDLIAQKGDAHRDTTGQEGQGGGGPAPAVPGPTPIAPPLAEDTHRSVARSWLDASFSADTGAGALPAFGAELRFAHMLDPERLFVTAAARCTLQQRDEDRLSILRPAVSAALGAIALRLGERLRFTVHAGVMLQLVRVTGADAGTGAAGEGGRWTPGLEEGLGGAWMASRTFGIVLGADATEATGAVDIRAHGQPLARLPAVDWIGQGGLRIVFP
jgi:hypothetical protein